MEWRDLQAVWNGDISTIRPLGDFVLVRPFPMEHGTGSLIINPGVHMTQDGRWRSNRLKGNQMGEVIAVGRGDRMLTFHCEGCGISAHRSETAKRHACCSCGGSLSKGWLCSDGSVIDVVDRYRMNVQPGDVVVYPQVPSNEVSINGERLIFLHEEQHILAVVEQEAA